MSEHASPLRVIGSILLLVLRLALGGMFVFAAWVKLSSPQEFAFSIKAFEIIGVESGEHVIKLLTFALPWAEMICGVLLILGLFTRSAAGLVSVQLLLFIAAIGSVLYRKLDVECGCFGEYDWPCGGKDAEGKPLVIGMCHIWRDVVMLAPALVLMLFGGGIFALDWPRLRSERANAPLARAPEPEDD